MQVFEQIEPQVADGFALLQGLLEPRKNGKSHVYILIVFPGVLLKFDKPDVLNYFETLSRVCDFFYKILN